MTVPIGAGKINPHPCNEQEQAHNWQNTSIYVSNIQNDITTIQADLLADSFKVKATTNDSTESFLHDAFTDAATYDSSADALVKFATVGGSGTNQTERAFLDSSAVTSYSGSGTFVLTITNGVLSWTAGGGDSFKVKSSVTDTTEEYLHDAIADAGTYESGEDLLVKCATIDKGSGNLAERLFVESDAMTGWTASGTIILAAVAGSTQWIASGGVADAFTVKITTDDTTDSFLHDAFHLNATYDSDEDLLVATATVGSAGTDQKERAFVDMDIVTGYAATGNNLLGSRADVTMFDTTEDWLKEISSYSGSLTVQVLGHNTGTVKWLGSFCMPRLAKTTGSIGVASVSSGDITPGSGNATLHSRPTTVGNAWPDDGGTITVYNLGGDAVDSGSLVWIDDQNHILSQFCTAPA